MNLIGQLGGLIYGYGIDGYNWCDEFIVRISYIRMFRLFSNVCIRITCYVILYWILWWHN